MHKSVQIIHNSTASLLLSAHFSFFFLFLQVMRCYLLRLESGFSEHVKLMTGNQTDIKAQAQCGVKGPSGITAKWLALTEQPLMARAGKSTN